MLQRSSKRGCSVRWFPSGSVGPPALRDRRGGLDGCQPDRTLLEVGFVRVEIVDPVGNTDFCENCHRVRVTHDGYLKGCLNRNDDLRSLDDRSRAAIEQALRETVAQRVPYYGEYLIENGDGEWVRNPAYEGSEGDRAPYEYADGDELPASDGAPSTDEQAATDGGDVLERDSDRPQ